MIPSTKLKEKTDAGTPFYVTSTLGAGGAEAIEALRRVPMFSELEPRKLESLLEESTLKTYKEGDTIIKDGSLLADMYVIVKGKVEVRKKGKVIARLDEGQFFGEMAVLNAEPTGRSADVQATERTTCIRIRGLVWTAFLRKNPDVAIEVIRLLASRLRKTSRSLSLLQNLPPASSA